MSRNSICYEIDPGGGGGGEPTGYVGNDGVFSEGWTDREEFKAHADTLGRFKNVGDLANSYIEARTKIGKNPDSLVEVPGENASDEVKAAWRKANGVPDSYEEYDYKLPDELAVKLDPIDDEKMKTVKEFAYNELGLSPAKFSKLMDFYHNDIAGTLDAGQAAFEEQKAAKAAESKDALKREWLDSYDDRVARANDVMQKYGGAEAVEEFNAENSPAMAKFLDNIAQAMSEDTLKGVSGAPVGLSLEGINSQIAEIRSQQDAIRKENPVNYKSDGKFKDLEGRLKMLYQKKPA